ncbi:MAG: proprotein convertase P-domain-containing protein [Myxococcota bacterium]|nr:proprotein convertase P-domain-containing protein [Myxococcota bacterium]
MTVRPLDAPTSARLPSPPAAAVPVTTPSTGRPETAAHFDTTPARVTPVEPFRALPNLSLDSGPVPPVGPFPPDPVRGHGGKPITVTATPNVEIADLKTVTSTLEVTEAYEIDTLKLSLDIGHSYRGDLVVKLTSPSGKTVDISNRQGGKDDDLAGDFDLSAFKGEQTKGTWTLTVEDAARLDTGTLRSWGIELNTVSRPEPATSVELPVLGLGAVKDRYTAEVHGKDGIIYATTWGNLRGKRGDTINIFDTKGGEPKAVGSITVPGAGTIGDVQVSDDGKLLLACTDRGQVLTYDLTDPTKPKLLGEYVSAGKAEVHTAELATVNGKLYAFGSIIYSRPPRVVTLDLSDPTKPREVNSNPVGSPYQHDVHVKDGLLFTAGWDQGMTIYDIGGGGLGGTPEKPVKISTLATKNGSAHNITTYKDPDSGKTFAFVGEEIPGSIGKSSQGDIHVVDITDLANPKEVAFFSVKGAGTHNFALDAEKGILYAAYYNGGVRAIDIRGDLAHGHGEEVTADGRIDLGKQNREVGHALGKVPGENYVWGVHLMDGELYASDMLQGIWKLDPSVIDLQPRPHEH